MTEGRLSWRPLSFEANSRMSVLALLGPPAMSVIVPRDDDRWRGRIAGGDAGVRPASARPNQRLHEAPGCHWMRGRFHRIKLEARRPRNAPVRPKLRDFHTAWAQMRSDDWIGHGPLSGSNRKTFARIEFFSI